MISDGLSFVAQDYITLDINAQGTHLSTSLEDLQKLGVDDVHLSGGYVDFNGVHHINIDFGSSSLNTFIPKFTSDYGAQLDLGLVVSNTTELTLALNDSVQLVEAGITSIDLNISETYWNQYLNLIPNAYPTINLLVDGPLTNGFTDINSQLCGVDLLSKYTSSDNYGNLLNSLQDSGVTNVLVENGNVHLSDDLASALISAGLLQAFPQSNLSIMYDATVGYNAKFGDYLSTSLKDLASLNVDQVDLSNATSNTLYIDSGSLATGETGLAELKSLLESLDPSNPTQSLFSTDPQSEAMSKVLVISNDIYTAMSTSAETTSIVDDLSKLGITKIDVLAANSTDSASVVIPVSNSTSIVTVNLIGQDSEQQDLFDFLDPKHHH